MASTSAITQVHRTGITLLAFQLQGLASGFTAAAAVSPPDNVPDSAVKSLEKLEAACKQNWSGPCIEGWPPLPTQPTWADLIVRAEILRTTAMAFLEPEELDDLRRGSIGFRE